MEIFIRTLLILLAVGLISIFAIKENKKYSGSNTIRLPKTYFWVGIVCVVFFFILFILLVTSPEKSIDWINSLIVSSVFLITSIAIITAYLNWQIEILNNKIIYLTFFRKKHEYEFNGMYYD